MKKAIVGKKIGMTQVFTEDGRLVPVTVIEAGPCTVVQMKNKETDGYEAVQVGFGEMTEQRAKKLLTKPELGHYKKANEANELEFCADVNMLIYQIEIYDQVWYVRHMPEEGRHSREAKELVEAFVAILENIPDGCAECFPFETIDELKREYLGQNEDLI